MREYFPNYKLTSEIVSYYPSHLIEVEGKQKKKSAEVWMRASLYDDLNNLVATGHAMEKEDSSFVNNTSYVENCETSAWGRCLANFGIGVDDSVSSADELANAIRNQK